MIKVKYQLKEHPNATFVDRMVKLMKEATVNNNYYINTTMKNKTLKFLMEDLEKVEQESAKIRSQINNIINLKND